MMCKGDIRFRKETRGNMASHMLCFIYDKHVAVNHNQLQIKGVYITQSDKRLPDKEEH